MRDVVCYDTKTDYLKDDIICLHCSIVLLFPCLLFYCSF